VANARKLDRLLNDLLDLDRLTHGIVAPKRRPTDVAALAAGSPTTGACSTAAGPRSWPSR
jgi:hypothetical protein